MICLSPLTVSNCELILQVVITPSQEAFLQDHRSDITEPTLPKIDLLS